MRIIHKKGRSILYLWQERPRGIAWEDIKEEDVELKFGDRFDYLSHTRQKWEKATCNYIRRTLGKQKFKMDDTEDRIHIIRIWDATVYAKHFGRNYPHAKVDDLMRPELPGHLKDDMYRGVTAEDFIAAVDEQLIKYKQTQGPLALTSIQYVDLLEVRKFIDEGVRRILADLTTRYGKTNWSTALIVENRTKLNIVLSYVGTSYTSFKNELCTWEQFSKLVYVNSQDPNYKERVEAGLAACKQVVVYVGMCNGGLRQDRIDFLFGKKVQRTIIVDEADFGIHKPKQVEPLKAAIHDNDILVLMTGSNADRAASPWKIDHMVSANMQDLITEKHHPMTHTFTGLRFFKVDRMLSKLVVDVIYFQMNLKRVAEQEHKRNPELFTEDGLYLPSLSKVANNPAKAEGFINALIDAYYFGKGGFDEVNMDLQMQGQLKPAQNLTTSLWWWSGAITNENLGELERIFRKRFDGTSYRVERLSGTVKGMKNSTVEAIVKQYVRDAKRAGKNLILLGSRMGQRSFSVKEVAEVVLAYDGGDLAATKQRMGRVQTPDFSGRTNKIGRIVSLSANPNRDDKYDTSILEAAINLMKHQPQIKDVYDAIKITLRTNTFLQCAPDGSVRFEISDYIEAIKAGRSLERVVGILFNPASLTEGQRQAMLAGNAAIFLAATEDVAPKGKTFIKQHTNTKNETTKEKNVRLSEDAELRNRAAMIAENIDIIKYFGGRDATLEESFALMDAPGKQNARTAVKEEFGMDYELVKHLILSGKINRHLIDLKFRK